jgi:hypothetical protein
MRRFKVLTLALLLATMGTVALVDEVAIGWYPPVGYAPDGRVLSYAPGDIRSCMATRFFSVLGDTASTQRWSTCAAALAHQGALAGFNWRYWALVTSCAQMLMSVLGFALAVRSDRVGSRVIRGRHLLAGDEARRAFLRSSCDECRQSGTGVELVPGLAVSRERETRHSAAPSRTLGSWLHG